MRLVLDTCVIVAAVKSATGASRILVEWASVGRPITAILSVPLLNQYEDVIFRPEHRSPEWSDEDLHALITSLLVPSELVETHFSYRPTLRDEGDELVLEAAINGHADIVTFNGKDFKPAAQFGIRILTPAEVLKRMLTERGMRHGTE